MIKTRVYTCTTHMAGLLARDEKHHFFMTFTLFLSVVTNRISASISSSLILTWDLDSG